jgi:hypothetical protein
MITACSSNDPVTPASTLTLTVRVGIRFKVTFSVSVAHIRTGAVSVEWDPALPRRLWPKEISDYRRGRDVFVAEMARITGGRTLVVEPGTGFGVIDPAGSGPLVS